MKKYSKPKKIFIVDDDEFITEGLTDYLSMDIPHQISVFHTGEEAVQSIEEKPDVIILDYYLNSKDQKASDGLKIIQIIKKHHPDAHIIMLSGQEHYGVALQLLSKGAEHYVIKDEEAYEKIRDIVDDI